MAKNTFEEFSIIAAENTDIAGIGIQGSNAVSNFDNGFRTLMAIMRRDVFAKSETVFPTIDGMSTTTVPTDLTGMIVDGTAAVGDGGPGFFTKVVGAPVHYNFFQSEDGAYFEQTGIIRSFHGRLVAEIANDMYLGSTILGAEIGDSTTVGADILNADNDYVADEPAPAKTQSFLRNYFFNSNITVQNLGINGFDTAAMITGAGGVLDTYREKIETLAGSGGRFVIINLGMNDMQDDTPTVPRDFRMNLILMERIARAYNLAVIFKTPNPAFAVPTYSVGTLSKAERSKNYAQLVRDVCRDTGAVCCDIYNRVMQFISTGIWPIQGTIPDGIHPTNEVAGVYRAIGQEVAGVFAHPHVGLNGPDQFVTAGGPGSACFPTSGATASPNTRMGMQLISTSASGAKTLNMVTKIEETGLDLVLAYPIWSGGAASVNVLIDGIGVGTISQFIGDDFGSGYIQQQELIVARNVTPGVHLVQISVGSGTTAIGANYLRTRETQTPTFYKNDGPFVSRSRQLFPRAELVVSNGSANAIALFDNVLTSRLNDGIDIEFTANLAKGEFVIVHGVWAANNLTGGVAFGAAVGGLMVGCDESTGYAQVREASGYSTFTETDLNAVDTSGVERLWRISIPAGLSQSATVVIDGSAYTPVSLTKPYIGGLLGLRKSGNGTMQIRDVRFLEH